MAFLTINGHECPTPTRGLGLQIATMVDAARNANGVVVSQKIGRDQQKIDSLYWAVMDADEWAAILQIFDENFVVTVKYPDMVNNTWTTRKMYSGDRTATPLWVDEQTGLPSTYRDCKVNLIDVGE